MTHPLNPSARYSPEWIYNEIMRFIEPELMTDSLPHLAEKYAGETPAENARRMALYDKAFACFDAAYAEVSRIFEQEAMTIKKESRSLAQSAEAEERGDALGKLEDAFDQPSPTV